MNLKKKLTAAALVVAFGATAVTGATLAYFTDTDQEDNVFTVGGVKIDLLEKQRNEAHNALIDFEDNKILMPIVGSAQGQQETVEGVVLPTAKNYVDKIINFRGLFLYP